LAEAGTPFTNIYNDDPLDTKVIVYTSYIALGHFCASI
jgi:hypothetical protein